MGFITNVNIDNERLYSSEKTEVTPDLLIDNGATAKEISDNMGSLITAAHKTLSNRKYIYDFKTKNKSFLILYNDLYRMGIKNNKFFLRLYDPDLRGVDVYNGVIPLDLQMKVLLEIIINPWYYLREIARIPEDGSPIEVGGGSQFNIDRNSLASWYCYLNGIDHYDSKSRQLGKTQNAIAQMNYAFLFGALSSTFLFFNKDQPLAKQNLYRLKCQRDMLPTWLQMKFAYSEEGGIDKGIDNITTVRNPITGNTIKVMPKATSRDAAIKLGRGETAAFHYHDEHDFTPYNTEIMKAASYAYSTASRNAQKNGSLYCRVLTSTPGYLNTKEGKEAAKQISRMLRWDDRFYDKPIEQIKKILNSSEYNGIMYIEHSWKQLKKSMAWYELQCKLVDYDADTIMREIELQRIQGNERSPFKKQQLMYITQHIREPIEVIDYSNNLSPINIYEKINPKIHYILSVDPAEGLGLNNNAFELINPHNQCPVAEFKSPYISPPDFFRLIVKFIEERCPKSLIVIEANRGRELINRFLESKFRYQLWYDSNKITSKVIETTDRYGAQRQSANERRAFGFDTTSSSKPLLFNILENMMMEQIHKLYTPYLVKDIASVQRKVNGAIVLGAGDDDDEGVGHGDNLMAYLIGLFVYFNAPNLEEFGIFRGASEPSDDSIPETPEQKREKLKNLMGVLPKQLQELFGSVLNEKDDISNAWEYERQVQQELSQYDMEHGNSDSIGMPGNLVDDTQWNQLNQQIFESNFKRNQQPPQNDPYTIYPDYTQGNGEFYGGGYSSNNGFDISNYID